MASIMSTFVYPMNVVNGTDGTTYQTTAWHTGAPTDGSSWIWGNHGTLFNSANPLELGCAIADATNQNPAYSVAVDTPFYKFANGDKPFIRRVRFTAPASILDYMALWYPAGVSQLPCVSLNGSIGALSGTDQASMLSIYGDLFSANEWIDVNTYLPVMHAATDGTFGLTLLIPYFQFEFSQKHSLIAPTYVDHAFSAYGSIPALSPGQFELKLEIEVVHNQSLAG